MLICLHCKEAFGEDDLSFSRGYRGECFGYDAYEDEAECPFCGSDEVEEAVKCERCREWFEDGELTDGFCKNCIDDFKADCKQDVDKCYKLVENDLESIEINAFLKSQFTVNEIEQILIRELKRAENNDFSNFLDNYEDWIISEMEEVKE